MIFSHLFEGKYKFTPTDDPVKLQEEKAYLSELVSVFPHLKDYVKPEFTRTLVSISLDPAKRDWLKDLIRAVSPNLGEAVRHFILPENVKLSPWLWWCYAHFISPRTQLKSLLYLALLILNLFSKELLESGAIVTLEGRNFSQKMEDFFTAMGMRDTLTIIQKEEVWKQ
jgi:hypothetical protein